MSVRLMSLVFNCNMPELKTDDGKTVPDTTAKSVLLALADNANDEGEGSYPGVDTLCKKTNYSTSTVCNALNALRHNAFTELVGKSKWDTNNYTISAARIVEFQWLKSSDSSHRNATVSAAETNPSNTSNKPPIKGIEILADKKVDAILEIERKAPGKTWTQIPELFQPLARAFCEATTLSYSKRQSMEWMSTFSDWMTAGYSPEMVTEAVRAICSQPNSPAISRPGSIEWKLRDLKVKKAQAAMGNTVQTEPQRYGRLPPSGI